MSGGAAAHKQALTQWLEEAVRDGWVDEQEMQSLAQLEDHGAERLFRESGGRPLTVGLFGGTGVGKSSLLNRLAGEAVARVGVERPTSTEVTLYIHEDYPLARLDEFLPVDRVRVLHHRRAGYRELVWIDMPDIDSVDLANRELVFDWLPYIDWLIYVVSPERYRDDAGWRVLQQRGHRHHWLFVMNRWDTGTEAQYADFSRILDEAGFGDVPLIRTSCTEPEGDELGRIVDDVDQALAEHGPTALQRVGERARLKDLHHQCDRYAEMLGGAARWRRFIEEGSAAMRAKLADLNRYIGEETAMEAARVARRASGEAAEPPDPPVPPRLLSEYIRDIESAIAVVRGDLPAEPIRSRTRRVLDRLPRRLSDAAAGGLRDGMTRPGNALQRAGTALMRKLVYALPLAVCLGIAYVVVSRYQQGLNGNGAFLGFDFMAHSLMVLGLAALVPYLIGRLIRPSVQRAIVKRVDAGLQRVQAEAIEAWSGEMNEAFERWGALTRSLDAIRGRIETDL